MNAADHRLCIAARAAEVAVALRLTAADVERIAYDLADLALASRTPIFFLARIVGQT